MSLKMNEQSFKKMAKKLHKMQQAHNTHITLSQAQEQLAKLFGYNNLHHYLVTTKQAESAYFKPMTQLINHQVLISNQSNKLNAILHEHKKNPQSAVAHVKIMDDARGHFDEASYHFLNLLLSDWTFVSDEQILIGLMNYIAPSDKHYNAGALFYIQSMRAVLKEMIAILRKECNLSISSLLDLFSDENQLHIFMSTHSSHFSQYGNANGMDMQKVKENIGRLLGFLWVLNGKKYQTNKTEYEFNNYFEFVIWMHSMVKTVHKENISLLIVAKNMFCDNASHMIIQYINHYLSKNTHIQWVFDVDSHILNNLPTCHYMNSALQKQE